MGQVLTEGETKVIEDAGGGEVLIRSKDDIMAHMVAAATGKDQESEKIHTLRS